MLIYKIYLINIYQYSYCRFLICSLTSIEIQFFGVNLLMCLHWSMVDFFVIIVHLRFCQTHPLHFLSFTRRSAWRWGGSWTAGACMFAICVLDISRSPIMILNISPLLRSGLLEVTCKKVDRILLKWVRHQNYLRSTAKWAKRHQNRLFGFLLLFLASVLFLFPEDFGQQNCPIG